MDATDTTVGSAANRRAWSTTGQLTGTPPSPTRPKPVECRSALNGGSLKSKSVKG